MTVRRRLVRLWLICLAACFAISPGLAQKPSNQEGLGFVQRSDDDLLLLSVHLDSITLSQDLQAYQTPGGVLLPLGEVCRLLELAVTVSPATGTADGFIAEPGRRFHADIRARRASLTGKDLPWDASLIEMHQDDIYIDSRLLNTWFSLGLTVDTHGLSVSVNPREPLPLQKRLERQRRAAQSTFSTYRDPGFPRVPNPYSMFGGPAIDQSLSLNFKPSNGSEAESVRYTAQVAADVAHLDVNAFFDVEPGHGSNASQLSIGQMDASGNLLGQFHAREVTLGQIYSPAVPLVSDAHLGRNLLISNYPLFYSSQFDTTTLAGILPPSWDVELYRDEALIGYQQASDTGRYEFKDIPLAFGNNRYRLVFYGPHGERREESHVFNIGASLIPRGENWYRLALQPGLGGGSQNSLQDEFGLRRNLSTAFGFATAPLSDGLHTYGSAGLRGFAGGLLGYTNVVADPRTGSAEELGLQWLWKRTTVEAKQTLVNGLVSQTLSTDVNPIREQTILRLGSVPTPRWAHLLPMDLEGVREETRMGTEQWEFSDRLSYQASGLGVTNWLSWKSETRQPSQGQGQLLINRWGGSHLMQGQVSYLWSPTPQLQQISLHTEKVLRDLRLQTLGTYYSATDHNYGITTGLTRTVGSYSYGITADLSTRLGLSVGLNLSMGLLRDPRSGRWKSDAQSQTARGAVSAHVFLDTNGNGKQDPGEQDIPGVEFLVNDAAYPKTTDKNGDVLINGLTKFQPLDLQVSTASLTNPLWMSKRDGVRIIPRPGSVPILEFPIVSTGEITGTVYEKDTTSTRPATGIALELVDSLGAVVQRQTSAYDGFYTFSRVPSGTFQIRIAPPESGRTGTAAQTPVRVPPEGAYLDGIDLTFDSPNNSTRG